MPGLSSVAGFARDHDMLTEFLLIDDIGVTGFADVVASEGDRAGCRLGDGCATVMAVLAKTSWNYGGVEHNEDDDRYPHDKREPNQVLDVFEHVGFAP